jgi:predicted MFS family arabinose efflux permease
MWPVSRAVSIMPIVLVVAIAVLVGFYYVERAKERRDASPLFPFAHLKIKTYRYGLLVGLVLAMGQFGLSFVLPVFLQGARLLTPEQNGWWQFPTGVFIILGAQLGGRLIRAVGTTIVVRIGLFSYAAGMLLIFHAVSLEITAWRLLPGLAFYGIGIGFAGAQLTNVVMSEVPAESSGVASGANTTVRQVGAALGVAMIGSLLSVQILSHSVTRIRAAGLSAAVKAQALAGVHAQGAFYRPPASTSPHDTTILQHALRTSVVGGTRAALIFATIVVLCGAMLSFLIPRVAAPESRIVENLEVVEPLDVDPALSH